MHTRHLAAIALLVVAASALTPACVAAVDSTDSTLPDDPGANMTPAETIGEVQQGLPFCECNVADDWCVGGKHCRAAVIPCLPTATFCGSLLKKPCNGWCLD